MDIGDCVERNIGGLTVRIDRTLCIGTANCMKVAPEVFAFDIENICAFTGESGEIERGRLIDACTVCPVDALIVIDESGTQLVPET
ncbi:MAG: ferredoxin [Candidatus Methylomirabilales bacterium]